MCDEGRENAETKHGPAQDEPHDPDFDASDEKGLVRVVCVTKSPDERRKKNRRPAVAQQPTQVRNGKCAEHPFFRNGREETSQKNEDPGEPCVQQVRVRQLRGGPGPEPFGGKVEANLVGKEKEGQRNPCQGSDEEPARSYRIPAEHPRDRKMLRIRLPVHGLRTGGQQQNDAPQGHAAQDGGK